MNLVKYCDDPVAYINMDLVESVSESRTAFNTNFFVYVIGSNVPYKISESAYETILKYGKAKV